MKLYIAIIVCCLCMTAVVSKQDHSAARQLQSRSNKNEKAKSAQSNRDSSQEFAAKRGDNSNKRDDGDDETTELPSQRRHEQVPTSKTHEEEPKLHSKSSQVPNSSNDETAEETSVSRPHERELTERKKRSHPRPQSRLDKSGDADGGSGDVADTNASDDAVVETKKKKKTELPLPPSDIVSILADLINDLPESELEELKRRTKIMEKPPAREHKNDENPHATSKKKTSPSMYNNVIGGESENLKARDDAVPNPHFKGEELETHVKDPDTEQVGPYENEGSVKVPAEGGGGEDDTVKKDFELSPEEGSKDDAQRFDGEISDANGTLDTKPLVQGVELPQTSPQAELEVSEGNSGNLRKRCGIPIEIPKKEWKAVPKEQIHKPDGAAPGTPRFFSNVPHSRTSQSKKNDKMTDDEILDFFVKNTPIPPRASRFGRPKSSFRSGSSSMSERSAEDSNTYRAVSRRQESIKAKKTERGWSRDNHVIREGMITYQSTPRGRTSKQSYSEYSDTGDLEGSFQEHWDRNNKRALKSRKTASKND